MRNFGMGISFAALMVLFSGSRALAGVYWLPDYLGDNSGRTNECKGVNCGGGSDYDCESYGYVRSCPVPQKSRGAVQPFPGLNCEKSCYCPGEFSKTCTGNYVGNGVGCDGLFISCQCKSSFIYDGSNCKSAEGFKLGSNLCGGKSDRCEAMDCQAGGYVAEKQANRKCTGVTYGGRTCYSCYQPECGEGGYKDAVPANNKCTAVSYYGRTCQNSCYQPSCSEGGYKDAVPANNKCTAVSYYGRTCQNSCYQPSCSAGGYKDSVPSGYSCTAVSYFGRSCQKDCKLNCAKECSLSSCPTGAVCRQESCSGKYCVTGCANGYKSCNGNCVSEQTCCNNACPWPAVCNDGKCEKCEQNGRLEAFDKDFSAKVPSDCINMTLNDYSGDGVSYYIPSDNSGYNTIELRPHGVWSNNSVMDIYGDLNIKSYLSIMPSLNKYTKTCNDDAICNATINFHGKVTLNGDLYLVTKIVGASQTHNLKVNFVKGLSGSYTCKKTAAEGWSSGVLTFTNYCPNGGPIN